MRIAENQKTKNMLYYNPNIRRKTTYKIPVIFDEEQIEKKELHSFSIFTEDFKEKEIVFNEKKINVYEYNPKNNFLDSLKVFNENNEMIKRYYFDIVDKEDSHFVDRKDSIILEFRESLYQRNRNVCYGYLELKDDNQVYHYKLSFHRVDSFLGYKVKVKLFKNEEGDFIREEFYNSKNDLLQFVLENKYEYIETDLEKRAQFILQNGWDLEF
ncbi:MAG: hypothetical protein PHP53_11975 [Prolixibacteraceae bacterium]|nr:hypothetical protein [Prolixibacteraceae bacterium]